MGQLIIRSTESEALDCPYNLILISITRHSRNQLKLFTSYRRPLAIEVLSIRELRLASVMDDWIDGFIDFENPYYFGKKSLITGI